MGFQVIRVEKLKSAPRVAGRIRHALRGRVPPNADPARVPENGYLVPGDSRDLGSIPGTERTALALDRWRKSLPPKYRKDAVTCLEFLVTGTNESLEALGPAQSRSYLRDAYAWIAERFGGEANIICAATHRDETTPHLSVFVVPIYRDERGAHLSAKHFIDGPKALADLHTEFNRDVAVRYGLSRGRFKSPAKHTSIKEFYAIGAAAMSALQRRLEEKTIRRREARKAREGGAER